MTVTAYSMLNVTATLDGRLVVGFMDGDNAIQVDQGADVGTMLVGADGTGLFSQSANRSAAITLRLKPNSPTHRQLTEKWKAQRAGTLRAFPFDFIDRGSNGGGNAPQCYIQKAPVESLGNNAVVREWVIVTAEYTPTVPDNL